MLCLNFPPSRIYSNLVFYSWADDVICLHVLMYQMPPIAAGKFALFYLILNKAPTLYAFLCFTYSYIDCIPSTSSMFVLISCV